MDRIGMARNGTDGRDNSMETWKAALHRPGPAQTSSAGIGTVRYYWIEQNVPKVLSVRKVNRRCLTQADRWRHSVSDVVEYVTTENVTRIYFQHTSCVHTPVRNSNTLGLYWLITSYFEAFFLKERMNICDNLHKLRISHRMSYCHYKQNMCVSQM
jgi:hypothetical protein